MTNADRIRAMTDENLARYIAEVSADVEIWSYDKPLREKFLNQLAESQLIYLQQPYKGGETDG